METIIVINDDVADNCITIFCRKCNRPTSYIDYDDYVDTNCMCYCNLCGPFLICPGPSKLDDSIDDNSDGEIDQSSIDMLISNIPINHDGCTKRVTDSDEIKKYIKLFGFDEKEFDAFTGPNYRFYIVNILCITMLPKKGFFNYMNNSWSSDDIYDDSHKHYQYNVNILFVKELESICETELVLLNYDAKCCGCNKQYQGCLSSD